MKFIIIYIKIVNKIKKINYIMIINKYNNKKKRYIKNFFKIVKKNKFLY